MSKRSAGLGALGGLALAGGIALGTYEYMVRPWHRRWGAKDDEVKGSLPGDAMVPGANYQSTRAITIAARPEQIWPWLAQMGQGRGGLYSYTALENMMGLDFQNANRIVPEWQDLKVGDVIALEPAGSGYTVVTLEPNRCLVLFADLTSWEGMQNTEGASTWVFSLRPVDEARSRLVVRWRARFLGWQSGDLVAALIELTLEPMEFVMERKMILGIRDRAEALGH
jgi:hypothetical protein